jgi:hypothetical protein
MRACFSTAALISAVAALAVIGLPSKASAECGDYLIVGAHRRQSVAHASISQADQTIRLEDWFAPHIPSPCTCHGPGCRRSSDQPESPATPTLPSSASQRLDVVTQNNPHLAECGEDRDFTLQASQAGRCGHFRRVERPPCA